MLGNAFKRMQFIKIINFMATYNFLAFIATKTKKTKTKRRRGKTFSLEKRKFQNEMIFITSHLANISAKERHQKRAVERERSLHGFFS